MPTSIITNRRDLNWNGTMNIQQRLTKLEQATTSQNIDLAGLIKVEHNADGTATVTIG